MTTVAESNPCSICKKPSAKFLCVGCSSYFCSTHFKEHEQQLSTRFDNEIVKLHDELFSQIQQREKFNQVQSDLFAHIEQWKKLTIEKIEKTAEQACNQLVELLDKQHMLVAKQFEPITKEIRTRREEDDFVESDIHRLRQQLHETQRVIQEIVRKDTEKSIIIKNDQIDWNQLIYIRGEQENSKYGNLKLSKIQL